MAHKWVHTHTLKDRDREQNNPTTIGAKKKLKKRKLLKSQ